MVQTSLTSTRRRLEIHRFGYFFNKKLVAFLSSPGRLVPARQYFRIQSCGAAAGYGEVCPFSSTADRAGLPSGGVTYPITHATTGEEVPRLQQITIGEF